jgi:hypothetical protein
MSHSMTVLNVLAYRAGQARRARAHAVERPLEAPGCGIRNAQDGGTFFRP